MADQSPEENSELEHSSAGPNDAAETPSKADAPEHAWCVTAAELNSLDLEAPIDGDNCADPACFEQRFIEASKHTNDRQSAVYRLLAIICSFHFRPSDKVEPFSNLWAMGGKRSLQGSDFDAKQIDALHVAFARFQNLALNTRIADLIWTRDKRKSECARHAIDGYVQLAQALLSGAATDRLDRNPALGMTTQNCLTRAAIVARQPGWNRDENGPLKQTILDAIELAKSSDAMALVRFGRLGVDLGLEQIEDRLSGLDTLAIASADKAAFHEAESLQKLSISLARRMGDKDRVRDETLKFTAILERKSDGTDSTMLKAHALQEAIDSLQGLKGVREERQRLHEKLTQAQLHVYEEMGQIEHSLDLTSEVERILSHLEDADLLECIRALAIAELPKSPEVLKEEARKMMRDFPLSSLFGASILDAKGRTVAKVGSATEGDDDSEALIHQVIKQEEIRIGIAVAGAIDPIRGMMSQRFVINLDVLEKICSISPFVPSGSETAFARGFQAFLSGDDLASAMILVPYLEAGLRAMVGVAGRSDTKIVTGGLEELIGLGTMLGQHRDVLERVFGRALIFAIEIIFVHELGPKVRHSLCHGLSRDGAFYSAWYVYACKLVFSLVFLPLIRPEHWETIKTAIIAETGLSDNR